VIAACNLIFGRKPLRVSATMDIDPKFGVDRLATALLDYGDAHASFTAASQAGTDAWATHQHFSVLGSSGWLHANFPYAHARPAACRVEVGDHTSVGSLATETREFAPVNQYALQVDRFSRLVRGDPARHWPIEESLATLNIIEAMFQSARERRSIEVS
jgi:predicted dehydrogenase